nr:Mitochondrial carrier protein MTM1 [Ipomoea batatas]
MCPQAYVPVVPNQNQNPIRPRRPRRRPPSPTYPAPVVGVAIGRPPNRSREGRPVNRSREGSRQARSRAAAPLHRRGRSAVARSRAAAPLVAGACRRSLSSIMFANIMFTLCDPFLLLVPQFSSAVLVNPLGVVKLFADLRCSPSCTRAGVHGTVAICPPDCFQYKGTLDVFYKIIRQEGISRLWRGTNAGLALAVPKVGIYLPCYDIFRNKLEEYAAQNAPSLLPYTPLLAGSLACSLACTSCYPIELAKTRMQAFKDMHKGKKPPGVRKTLFEVISSVKSTANASNTRLGAQLARDVPFSAICWSTLEPARRRLLGLTGDEDNAARILGANFSAGFLAGSLAAAAT